MLVYQGVTHALKHQARCICQGCLLPRNWVLLATAAVVQSHEFGTKLPANFINSYEPLYGKDPSVSLGPVSGEGSLQDAQLRWFCSSSRKEVAISGCFFYSHVFGLLYTSLHSV